MEPGFLGMWIRAMWEPGQLPAHCRDVDRLYFGAGHLGCGSGLYLEPGSYLVRKYFFYEHWLVFTIKISITIIGYFCEYWVLIQYEVGNLYLNGWLGEKRR